MDEPIKRIIIQSPGLIELIKSEIEGTKITPREYIEMCICDVVTRRTGGDVGNLLANFINAKECGQWDMRLN